MESVYLFMVAGFLLLVLIFAPQLVTLRIRLLRHFHFNWLAGLHDRHFNGFVMGIRIVLATLVVFLIGYGIYLYP